MNLSCYCCCISHRALNLLCIVSMERRPTNPILNLYRSFIRSKLDYGCVVYGSSRSFNLRMLDAIQNHALRLCLGAYWTTPSSSCVLANEHPLCLPRKKLSMQYCLKHSSTSQNPAYSVVFAGKFKFFFNNKPNQIPTLGTECSVIYRRSTYFLSSEHFP